MNCAAARSHGSIEMWKKKCAKMSGTLWRGQEAVEIFLRGALEVEKTLRRTQGAEMFSSFLGRCKLWDLQVTRPPPPFPEMNRSRIKRGQAPFSSKLKKNSRKLQYYNLKKQKIFSQKFSPSQSSTTHKTLMPVGANIFARKSQNLEDKCRTFPGQVKTCEDLFTRRFK